MAPRSSNAQQQAASGFAPPNPSPSQARQSRNPSSSQALTGYSYLQVSGCCQQCCAMRSHEAVREEGALNTASNTYVMVTGAS